MQFNERQRLAIALHDNSDVYMSKAYQLIDILDAAGAFAPAESTLPTRSEIESCIYGNSALEGVNALIAAGFAREDDPEPAYSDDDVRELCKAMGMMREESGWTAEEFARAALESGYRKASQ